MFSVALSLTLCSTLRTCMITISKVRHINLAMNIEAKMWNKMHGYGSILWSRALFKLWVIEHLNPMFLSLVEFIYTWILFVKSRICKNEVEAKTRLRQDDLGSCVRKISRIWTADANSSFFKWTWNNSTQSSQIILLRSQQITIYQKKFKKNHIFFYFHHFICGSLLLGIRGGYKSGKTKKMNHNEAVAPWRPIFISSLTKSPSHTIFFEFTTSQSNKM